MQKEEAHLTKIKLEIQDPDLKLLKTFLYTRKKRYMTYWDIIRFTRETFFDKLNSYKQFGETNYSHLKFSFFKLISCNGLTIENKNYNTILPEELCEITIVATGKKEKVIITSTNSSCKNDLYKAKFFGITKRSEQIKMEKIINLKNIERKHIKLMAQYGPDYSMKKFEELKLVKEETLVKK